MGYTSLLASGLSTQDNPSARLFLPARAQATSRVLLKLFLPFPRHGGDCLLYAPRTTPEHPIRRPEHRDPRCSFFLCFPESRARVLSLCILGIYVGPLQSSRSTEFCSMFADGGDVPICLL